jgi:CHAD domain-containing protein
VRRQIDDVLHQLRRPGAERDAVVHEVRKCFKKVRAVLRLVRDGLDDKVYRRENACFRDAGRPLTEVRDAKALIETLDELAGHFADRAITGAFDGVRRTLLADRRAVRQRVLHEANALAAVADAVKKARGRLRDWAVRPKGWSAVRGGLKRVYQSGRDAFTVAAADPTADNLHEWRKQAKYLYYQLEVFEPAWPGVMMELGGLVRELTQLLGDDHNLAVLRQKMATHPTALSSETIRETLLDLIDRRRGELQREAFRLGRRVYRDKPRAFTDRLKRSWTAWRSGTALPTG